MAIQFDPRSPEFRRNPYPYYDMLRANAPIYFWEDWGVYFLTGWEECRMRWTSPAAPIPTLPSAAASTDD